MTYYWLRRKSNPAVVRYLEEENAYTASMTADLEPFAEKLYTEMLSHIKQTDLRVPVRTAAVSITRVPKKANSIRFAVAARAAWKRRKKFFSISMDFGKAGTFVEPGDFVVSDDQNLLAYTLDYTGFRQFTLHVKDLRTGPDSDRLPLNASPRLRGPPITRHFS